MRAIAAQVEEHVELPVGCQDFPGLLHWLILPLKSITTAINVDPEDVAVVLLEELL